MNRLPTSSIQAVSGLTELVKGREQQFLKELQPLVVRGNVTLDLDGIHRIDAAGVAALASLYRDASKSGYRFAVVNPSARVQEVLRMVGLDAILVSRNAEEVECFTPQLQETAA